MSVFRGYKQRISYQQMNPPTRGHRWWCMLCHRSDEISTI